MRYRMFASVTVATAMLLLMSSTQAAGQAPPSAAAASGSSTWTAPRTPFGHPDLQGVWANNNVTPLERPKELAGREFLTDQELATLKRRAEELFGGDGDAAFGDSVFETVLRDVSTFSSRDTQTGNYNHFWIAARDWDNRTSLIVTPKDGRLPPSTPRAEAREAARSAARQRPAAGPEDRSLSERCITFGVPRIGAAYNSYFQIAQTPEHVAIAMETIHDVRIIPLDGRAHVHPSIRQWHGDSRGRWEGDTLVVDTTNYSSKSNFRSAAENLHVVERFTRVSPDVINYEITVDDPDTWTEPWTAMIPLRRSTDRIYEYECHEGNTGMAGILSGSRAMEAKEAQAVTRQGSSN